MQSWHSLRLLHWNKNVVILTKFSSLAALEVVILTTSSAASDEHFIKMKTFPFQCTHSIVVPDTVYHDFHLLAELSWKSRYYVSFYDHGHDKTV